MPAPRPRQAAYGVHWFRRDLRVAGNPALRWSRNEHRGRVLGLMSIDATFLARADFSADRFAFFLATVGALRDDLRAAGGDLLVIDAGPRDAFPALCRALDAAGIDRPASVSFNRDYEPFARARDEAVAKLLAEDLGVAVHTESDHLLVQPEELRKPEDVGGARGNAPFFYQVYSAFARRWFDLLATPPIRARVLAQRQGLLEDGGERGRPSTGAANANAPAPFALSWARLFEPEPAPADPLSRLIDEAKARAGVPLPAPGGRAARERLRAFAARVGDYKTQRDFPAVDGTSRMSIYFKNGSFTTTQAIAELDLENATFAEGSGASSFLREIVWREFFYHVLWHRPDVETRAFLPQFRALAWSNREDWFAAWKAGTTGYPIVDAGMRQLAETGWMHNRVRMIVASFLTKDLLIDWRWGERYFMERLLDGDLAPNNGGWQWAASTGCDPQPYFRVFNPTLQGKRFDPTGAYLRRFLPERRGDDAAAVHLPRDPIVDHATQKEKALAMYRDRGAAGDGGAGTGGRR